ncbi:MAG: XRE family transcriptional regulator [Candidatus Angelobacter sp. Gp1-AA117]|nr:MAG: XRE family transcriptional regulator [Candidatus Angelobacter sp. Gp1-AA117]
MQEDIQIQIGLRIKALREKTGLNQDDFADICGLHRAYVGKIENGRFDFRIKTLHKIAHALKIDLSGLLKGID